MCHHAIPIPQQSVLSPGPDFFLVALTSISAGWRVASGACLGIALANGVFILAAFTGVSALRPDSGLFITLQLTGCAYLLYLGGPWPLATAACCDASPRPSHG